LLKKKEEYESNHWYVSIYFHECMLLIDRPSNQMLLPAAAAGIRDYIADQSGGRRFMRKGRKPTKIDFHSLVLALRCFAVTSVNAELHIFGVHI
jgi:hypothetical protein